MCESYSRFVWLVHSLIGCGRGVVSVTKQTEGVLRRLALAKSRRRHARKPRRLTNEASEALYWDRRRTANLIPSSAATDHIRRFCQFV